MRRRSVQGVMLLLLGAAANVLATGSYPPSGFSFLTSETRSYPPFRTESSFVFQKPDKVSLSAVQDEASTRPVIRSQRGIAYIEAPTVYVAKAPLLYPETTVFSDPLPVVQLPQLPAEFLTLKTVQQAVVAGGDDKEDPKKKDGPSRRGRKNRGKKQRDEDIPQDTESDDAVGGYPSSRQRQSSRSRSRSRDRDARGRGRDTEASGGYQSSVDDGNSVRSTAGRDGASGGYQGSFDANSARSAAGRDGASGGYPSSFDANDARSAAGNNGVSGGYQDSNSGNFGSSSSGSNRGGRRGQESRRNRNRGNSAEDLEEQGREDEFMMTGDDAMIDNAAEVDDDESVRGRGRNEPRKSSGRRGGKGRGSRRNRLREENAGSEEDEVAALSKALSEKSQSLGTFYIPTFGNNVLNTVYPAFSQNLLLKTLSSQGNEGYPESGMDVEAISISADDDEDDEEGIRSSKSKKKTSQRKKNRPSRLRSNSARSRDQDSDEVGRPRQRDEDRSREDFRDRDNDRENLDDEDEEADSQRSLDDPSSSYGAPSRNSRNREPSSEYGTPSRNRDGSRDSFSTGQTRSSDPNQEYGAPRSLVNPPPQSGQGGYRTIGNELRDRSPQQSFGTRGQSQSQPQQAYGVPVSSRSGPRLAAGAPLNPQQSYGAPNSQQSRQSFGTPAITQARLLEPRQLSQSTSINGGQLGENGQLSQELIRTVQAILEKYPN